jgi:26S proteasome regulatory subunit N3
VERRSLRSNSKGDTSSSANGDKARSNSNSKDKAAPTTRSAANKAKPAPAKKAAATAKGASGSNNTNTNNNNMSGDQPQRNGTDPAENGVEDVEMEEDTTAGGPTSSIQTSWEHDGDEMTVVVPPSKASRLSAADSKKNDEDDVAMEGADDKDSAAKELEVDPREKAIQGEFNQLLVHLRQLLVINHTAILSP